jgi:hypothetical protein
MEGVDFSEKVSQWAHDRNLVEGSTPIRQCKKLLEEATELYGAVVDNDLIEIADGVGDVEVVLRVIETQLGIPFQEPSYSPVVGSKTPVAILFADLSRVISRLHSKLSPMFVGAAITEARLTLWLVAKQHGLTIGECRAHAWNDIKDRKGKMVGGIFVREPNHVA